MNTICKVIKKSFEYIERKRNPVAYARKIGCQVGEIYGFNSSVNFGSEPWLITIENDKENYKRNKKVEILRFIKEL